MYQQSIDGPTSGSLLSWINYNCTYSGVYVVAIGNIANITDLPSDSSFRGYCQVIVVNRIGQMQVYTCGYGSYSIFMNVYSGSWMGWKKIISSS